MTLLKFIHRLGWEWHRTDGRMSYSRHVESICSFIDANQWDYVGPVFNFSTAVDEIPPAMRSKLINIAMTLLAYQERRDTDSTRVNRLLDLLRAASGSVRQ